MQILWMNLVTDGVTALALGLEPAENGIMRRAPRKPGAPLLDRVALVTIASLGAYSGAAALWLFHAADPGAARTTAFCGLVVFQLANVLNFRALRAPLSSVGYLSNPPVLWAIGGMAALQAAAVYAPFLQQALKTIPLGFGEWVRIGVVAVPLFLIPEAIKRWRWRHAGPG